MPTPRKSKPEGEEQKSQKKNPTKSKEGQEGKEVKTEEQKNKEKQDVKESSQPISRRIDSRGRSLKRYLEKKATEVGRNVSARMSQFGNYLKR
jgi:hypothetical protein